MTTYKTSKDSKNRIIEASKELFYKQGYDKTTYIDICKKGNSNPGLINYYFKTKQNIAAHIHGEFIKSIKESVETYLIDHYDQYNLQFGTTLEIRIFTDLISRNKHLSAFYHEICTTGLELDADILFDFYKLHVDAYDLPFSDDEVKLIQTSVVGAGIAINKKMIEGFFDCDEKTIFEFRVRSMFKMMGVSDDRIDEILIQTEEIFDQMNFGVEDYFTFNLES